MANNTGKYSGIAVALSFAALGLLILLVWPNSFAVATTYVGASMVIFGILGFLVELSKVISIKKYRFDSLGVGLLLLIPFTYVANIVYEWGIHMAIKIPILTVLYAVLLFGLYGVFDFVVSFLEDEKDFKVKIVSVFKFLVILIPSISAVLVAIRQILNEFI